MEWFEYLIIVIAIGLVALPIVLEIKNRKQGKKGCGCKCDGCHQECPLKKK